MADKYSGIASVALSKEENDAIVPFCYIGDDLTVGSDFATTTSAGCIATNLETYSRGIESFKIMELMQYFIPRAIGEAANAILQSCKDAKDDLGQNFWLWIELTDADTTVGTVGATGTIIKVPLKLMSLSDTFKRSDYHTRDISAQGLATPTEIDMVAGTAA